MKNCKHWLNFPMTCEKTVKLQHSVRNQFSEFSANFDTMFRFLPKTLTTLLLLVRFPSERTGSICCFSSISTKPIKTSQSFSLLANLQCSYLSHTAPKKLTLATSMTWNEPRLFFIIDNPNLLQFSDRLDR